MTEKLNLDLQPPQSATVPWIDYLVGMFKLNIFYTVASEKSEVGSCVVVALRATCLRKFMALPATVDGLDTLNKNYPRYA